MVRAMRVLFPLGEGLPVHIKPLSVDLDIRHRFRVNNIVAVHTQGYLPGIFGDAAILPRIKLSVPAVVQFRAVSAEQLYADCTSYREVPPSGRLP